MANPVERLTTALEGRYSIERELGAGGMATVYLAHDVRHNRKVALKVLRPELAAILGGERFLKEIQTTANLQHPHILPLHDSGEADDIVYYVMPYVEGESLRDRLLREKQLPVEDAVRIAGEVASALDYAHRHGVVHRDIKPENILLHEGQALVADFGIALAVSTAGGGTRITETGMSLGTPHYMAPEQAMGEREITPKADIYALGCVLYEMLTGEPPFTGPTAQAIVARVMTEQPRALTLQRHTIPPHVDAAVRVALEKLPADRFATAAQFAEALEKPGMVVLPPTATYEVAAPRPTARRRLGTLVPWAFVAALTATSGLSLWKWLASKPQVPTRPLVRFGIQLPREAAPAGALGSTIAFAPDGSRFVYVGTGPSNTLLYSRGLDQLKPVAIPGSDGGSLPFFSSTGQDLGFKQGTRLMRVALAGGPVAVICTAPGSTYGATWTASDTIIFASDSGLMEVPALGGDPRRIARPDTGEQFMWPDILPGDRSVLFAVIGHGAVKLAALDRRTGSIKRLQQTGSYPRYVTAGFVVVNDPSGSVLAVPFDAPRVVVTGPAMPLAEVQTRNPIGDFNLGVSRAGDFAYQSATSAGSRLLLVDRSGGTRDAGSDTGYYYGPRLSPDGNRVALTRAAAFGSPNTDVWILDLVQHTRTRLTFDTTASDPVWTPDGRRVAYTRGTSIYWVPADGSGAPESLVTVEGQWFPAALEPGGRGLVYHGVRPLPQKGEIWRIDLADRAPHEVLAAAFHNYDPSLSPDGRWMAYQSDESGRFEVYVRPFPGPGGRWQVSLNGGTEPVWSRDGREIFYRSGDDMMAAAVRTQGAFSVSSRSQLFSGTYAARQNTITNYDVSPDGRTFLMLQRVQGLEQSVFVTLNWFDQLRRRAASR